MNEKVMLVIGYVIPLVPSIVFSVPGVSYQVASATEFVTFIIPLVYLLFVYGKIAIETKKILDQESAKKLIQEIRYYPLVLGVNLMLIVIASLIGFESECMSLFCAILDSCWCLQGLIDAILYGNNSIVRKEMLSYWRGRSSPQASLLSAESFVRSSDATNVIYSNDH